MNSTISQLSEQYRSDFWKLCDFDLELKPGISGLPGANCASKSALMCSLAAIMQPS